MDNLKVKVFILNKRATWNGGKKGTLPFLLKKTLRRKEVSDEVFISSQKGCYKLQNQCEKLSIIRKMVKSI